MNLQRSPFIPNKKLVTLALHFGKIDYLPLVENFLKSLLICVTYPNIELMLVETAGNRSVRKWFESLDFSTNFINYNGSQTSISKHGICNIQKSLVFLDPDPKDAWYMSFSKGISAAIRQARGEYFVILSEDNQFNVKGPLIQSYIDILELKGNERSFVHFMTQHEHKYHKKNNSHVGPFENKDFRYFQVPRSSECTKWCPFGLTKLKNYDLLGGFPIPKLDEPSNIPQTILSQKAYSLKMTRFYPQISHGVWLHNDLRKPFVKKILEESKSNPNYVLYPMHGYNKLAKTVAENDVHYPLSTERFLL